MNIEAILQALDAEEKEIVDSVPAEERQAFLSDVEHYIAETGACRQFALYEVRRLRGFAKLAKQIIGGAHGRELV